MRVVAGQHKGRPIDAPQGQDTRPTLDRVRESLMSSIYSLKGDFDNLSFADVFSGSGALGIESLSRGADFVYFCDISPLAITCIEKNLGSLNEDSSKYQVQKKDILNYGLSQTNRKYDVVYLDPPYKIPSNLILQFISDTLNKNYSCNEDCLFIYEHSKDMKIDELELTKLNLEIIKSKNFGKVAVDFIVLGTN